jgi:hypothetical protein
MPAEGAAAGKRLGFRFASWQQNYEEDAVDEQKDEESPAPRAFRKSKEEETPPPRARENLPPRARKPKDEESPPPRARENLPPRARKPKDEESPPPRARKPKDEEIPVPRARTASAYESDSSEENAGSEGAASIVRYPTLRLLLLNRSHGVVVASSPKHRGGEGEALLDVDAPAPCGPAVGPSFLFGWSFVAALWLLPAAVVDADEDALVAGVLFGLAAFVLHGILLAPLADLLAVALCKTVGMRDASIVAARGPRTSWATESLDDAFGREYGEKKLAQLDSHASAQAHILSAGFAHLLWFPLCMRDQRARLWGCAAFQAASVLLSAVSSSDLTGLDWTGLDWTRLDLT